MVSLYPQASQGKEKTQELPFTQSLMPSTHKPYELQTSIVDTLTAQHKPQILVTDFNA